MIFLTAQDDQTIRNSKNKMMKPKAKNPSFLINLKNLLGVGIYLLFIGMLIEGLMVFANRYVSIPISIPFGWQMTLTLICMLICLSGMIWFNKTLNLAKIYFVGGENKLITQGPFNYVRHPLYSTLMITLPPLLIIWFEDIVFIVPWLIIFVIAPYAIRIEENGLVRLFGEKYKKYKEVVPCLFPFKGSAGEEFREYYHL